MYDSLPHFSGSKLAVGVLEDAGVTLVQRPIAKGQYGSTCAAVAAAGLLVLNRGGDPRTLEHIRGLEWERWQKELACQPATVFVCSLCTYAGEIPDTFHVNDWTKNRGFFFWGSVKSLGGGTFFSRK
jgi:hypothetical protein